MAKSIGIKPKRRDTGSDEHRPQTQHRAFDHGEFDIHPFASQFVEVADHDDAVEDGDAEECDEANARADAQIEVHRSRARECRRSARRECSG